MSVIKAQLETLRKDFGGYIIYVFKNLDFNPNSLDGWKQQYVLTTRFPNWECPLLKVGDKGFLEFKEVEAGKDTWFDKITGSHIVYKYDNIIFINFVHDIPESDLTVML